MEFFIVERSGLCCRLKKGRDFEKYISKEETKDKKSPQKEKMKTLRILILEDDLKTLAVIMDKFRLSEFASDLSDEIRTMI